MSKTRTRCFRRIAALAAVSLLTVPAAHVAAGDHKPAKPPAEASKSARK